MRFELVRLGDLGEIVSGSMPDTTKKSYWGGDISWITPADLTDHEGIYFTANLRKITEAGYKSCSTKMLPTGSILFSSRAPIGHCAVTSFPLCTNQGFKSLIPNERLDPVYGFFALKFFKPQIEAIGRGATFAEVNKELFENFCIPLPPLAEQKRIADLLARADRLRRLRRYARELSDTYLQSVFVEIFGYPRTNTKNWKTTKFSNVCESRLGKMLDEKQQTGKHVRPYMRNFNVQWGKFDLSDVAEMDFDDKDREEFRLEYGDILICEGGEVGRSAIWHYEMPECYFQKALHRARPNPKLANPEYILWLMWWMAKTGGLGDFTSQVTIAHLTGEKLKELIIPVPPLPEQECFVRVAQRYERLRVQQAESERQGENLFRSLLHEAFGEYTMKANYFIFTLSEMMKYIQMYQELGNALDWSNLLSLSERQRISFIQVVDDNNSGTVLAYQGLQWDLKNRELQLQKIVVDEAVQNSGIGTTILKMVIAIGIFYEAARITGIIAGKPFLWKWYPKLGFTIHDDNKLLMELGNS